MIFPLLQRIYDSPTAHALKLKNFHELLGLTKQGYHQGLKVLLKEQEMMLSIEKRVDTYRLKKDRRAGSRSLYYNLNIGDIHNVGVNKFEGLMSKYGLTLCPLDVRVVTTKSVSQSWNYNNLVQGLTISGINQVVVGDITHIGLGKSRYYLFCLLDIYSQRIVGYCLSMRMRSIEAIEAIKMMIKLRSKDGLKNCIHHTDGGGQYFAKKYLAITSKLKIQTSVSKTCIENGYAEQINGLIKNHLIPIMNLENQDSFKRQFAKMVRFYNNDRKQNGLGWLSPVDYEKEVTTRKKTIIKHIK